MTTATATAEKTVFKRETLELKNIHVYTQNDRINQKKSRWRPCIRQWISEGHPVQPYALGYP